MEGVSSRWFDPGGAPFSQLSNCVKDARVESTESVKCNFVTKTCKKAEIETTRSQFGNILYGALLASVMRRES